MKIKAFSFACLFLLMTDVKSDITIVGLNILSLDVNSNPSQVIISNPDGLSSGNTFILKVKYQGSIIYEATSSNRIIPGGTTGSNVLFSPVVTFGQNVRATLIKEFAWKAPGEYQTCMTILDASNNLVDEYCDTYEEFNTTEIDLLVPETMLELDEVSNQLVSFCWASNLPGGNYFLYSFKIYPVLPGQTDMDAAMLNVPIFSTTTGGLCAQINGNILHNSEYNKFVWRVEASFSEDMNSENGSFQQTNQLGVSDIRNLLISSETILEQCYITPMPNLSDPAVYGIKNSEVRVDLAEFTDMAYDSVSLVLKIEETQEQISVFSLKLKSQKRFYKIKLPEETGPFKEETLIVYVVAGEMQRMFQIKNR